MHGINCQKGTLEVHLEEGALWRFELATLMIALGYWFMKQPLLTSFSFFIYCLGKSLFFFTHDYQHRCLY